MKRIFCICLFLTVSSIYAENNPWLFEPGAVLDQQGVVFQPIANNYYTDKEAEAYKTICPYGVIKILIGYINSKGEEVAIEGDKIWGCDTEQEYKDNIANGTYIVLRTNRDVRDAKELNKQFSFSRREMIEYGARKAK
jgi:hypothetical protein